MVKLTEHELKLAAARQAAFYHRNKETILLRMKSSTGNKKKSK